MLSITGPYYGIKNRVKKQRREEEEHIDLTQKTDKETRRGWRTHLFRKVKWKWVKENRKREWNNKKERWMLKYWKTCKMLRKWKCGKMESESGGWKKNEGEMSSLLNREEWSQPPLTLFSLFVTIIIIIIIVISVPSGQCSLLTHTITCYCCWFIAMQNSHSTQKCIATTLNPQIQGPLVFRK